MRRLSPLLPLSDVGKRATEHTLRVWYKEDKWKERADRMDKSVAHEIEQVAIEEKVLMLKRHAKAAKLLVEKGMEFLEEFEIKKPADAIKAIKDGAELERLSRGGPLALDDFGKWTDGDLVKFITDQLQERRNTKALLTEGQDDSDDVIEGEISDESPDEQ